MMKLQIEIMLLCSRIAAGTKRGGLEREVCILSTFLPFAYSASHCIKVGMLVQLPVLEKNENCKRNGRKDTPSYVVRKVEREGVHDAV